MKQLVIVRGVPGSGKSTFAKTLGGKHYEADMYFMYNGSYNFAPERLKDAHEWCRSVVETSMEYDEELIVVSNTFTQEWEMKPYYKLAEKYNYTVFSIIVENRHGGVNTHNVPEEKIQQMKNRFNVKL